MVTRARLRPCECGARAQETHRASQGWGEPSAGPAPRLWLAGRGRAAAGLSNSWPHSSTARGHLTIFPRVRSW
eukprot:5932075-Lingulodinium_polyedra.AAC.1